MAYIFWLLFSFHYYCQLVKRSTLAKIWGAAISIQNSECRRLNSNSEYWKWTVWETEIPSDLHWIKVTRSKKPEKPVNTAVLDSQGILVIYD